MTSGIINIFKEKGYTSHDVVAKARRILNERKIGHAGTLDPNAEGVLPLCIGNATKVIEYLANEDKCYEAEVILGANTTTEDETGEIIERFPVNVNKEEIEHVINTFTGEYIQIPPMYSAIKVNGVRLYELARKGIVIERPKRQVYIYECFVSSWISRDRFKIKVRCSKGTYVRTLCSDIGKKLNCGAYMGGLLRTKVGRFDIKHSISLSELENIKDNLSQYIYSIDNIFEDFPKAFIKDKGKKSLYNGNKLFLEDINIKDQDYHHKVCVYDEQCLRAIYVFNQAEECFYPEKMFLPR